MFIAKRLKKMALAGLTFGEHCANLATKKFVRNVLSFLESRQIDTGFMRIRVSDSPVYARDD